ncbi:hypothetical protein ACFXOQ_36800, partial [Streptomyces californicus]
MSTAVAESKPVVVTETVRHPVGGAVLVVLGAVLAVAALLWMPDGRATTFRLDQTVENSWTVSTFGIVVTLAVLTMLLGVLMLARAVSARTHGVIVGVAATALVIAVLSWVVTPGVGFPVEFVLATTLFLALPFIFGALSGVVCERSGVINLGIEGQFLAGAFTAVLFASITGNPYVGILAAVLSGMVSTMLLDWLATRFDVNQLVTGVILNLLALGLTGFLFERLMRMDHSLNQPSTVPRIGGFLHDIGLGFLTDIPILGPVLFDQNLF